MCSLLQSLGSRSPNPLQKGVLVPPFLLQSLGSRSPNPLQKGVLVPPFFKGVRGDRDLKLQTFNFYIFNCKSARNKHQLNSIQ
jgi:hypothetical protein